MSLPDIPFIPVPEPAMFLQQVGIEIGTGRPMFIMVPSYQHIHSIQESPKYIGMYEQEDVAEAVITALALQAIQLFIERLPQDPFEISGRWYQMQDGPAIPWELAEILYEGEAVFRRYRSVPLRTLEEMEGNLSYQRASMQWVNNACRIAMLAKLRELGVIE